MSVPGEFVWAWGDNVNGAVVLKTSRHKRTFSRDEAELVLAMYDMVPERIGTWRSHTKRARAEGCDLGFDCDGAGWCENGEGRAWVTVLYGRYDDAPLSLPARVSDGENQ